MRRIRAWRRASLSCTLLDLVGFRPELSECVVSREELVPESQYFQPGRRRGGQPSAAPAVASR